LLALSATLMGFATQGRRMKAAMISSSKTHGALSPGIP